MNPMSIMAQAEKLGIPQLQRSIQDGTVPAFIGIPLLQEKVKRAKQMQNASVMQQPKRPSVAEQINQEADQTSMYDMMRQRAAMMQGQMAGTGGISDMLRKPEPEAMAEGGEVKHFYEGQLVPSASLYNQDLAIDDAAALAALSPEQRNYFASLPNGREAAIGAGRQILSQRTTPQRYRNILPTGDITRDTTANVPYFKSEAPVAKPYSSDMPEMQTLTRKILDKQAKEQPVVSNAPKDLIGKNDVVSTETPYNVNADRSDMYARVGEVAAQQRGDYVPAYTPSSYKQQYYNDLVQTQPANPTLAQAQPTVKGITPLAPGMAETLGVLRNQASKAEDQRSMAERMQLRAEQPALAQRTQVAPGANAPAVGTQTPYGAALTPTQSTVAQGLAEEAVPTQRRQAADYIKEMKDALGEGKAGSELKEFLEQQGKEYSEAKGKAPWMALMQAGLATMAGTSPFALANIGAGGMKGMQTYMEDMKDLRKEQDKAKELRLKAAQLQDEKDMAIAKYGLESKHADDIQDRQDRNTDKQIASSEKIAQMKDATDRAQLAISRATAGRPTEATMAMELATATAALKGEKDPEKRTVLENRIEGLSTGLKAMQSYGGSTANIGWHESKLALDRYKTLTKQVKDLGFKYKPDTNEEHALIRDELERLRPLAMGAQQIAGNSSVTPPPAGGAQQGFDYNNPKYNY